MTGPAERAPRTRLAWRFPGSPRRRVVVAAIATALLLVAGTVVAASWGSPGASARQPSGLAIKLRHGAALKRGRELAPKFARPAGPAQDRPGPVVLVPGYGGDTGSLDVLASRIEASGRQAIILRLPGGGTGSLVPDAALLNATVHRALRHGAPSVDVIGYSAGGVVALLWARRDDGAASARRVITLGAPFHGTQLAAMARALVPGSCPAACRQLVPGSSLLSSLDLASPVGLPPWLSLWTTDDVVVSPPTSARLAGAIDVSLQAICPKLIVSHTQLPSNPAVVTMVLAAIGRAPLTRPVPSACT